MRPPFIPLDRRFRELTEEEITKEQSKFHLNANWFSGYGSLVWSNLEERFRTIILAEGGAGKTREMKERYRVLKEEGKFAFFLPLEALSDTSVEELLKLEDEYDSFSQWKGGTDDAILFLDAVDELKLKDESFETALKQLKLALGNAQFRVRIIISCRPSDWYKIDTGAFKEILPPPKVTKRDIEPNIPEIKSKSPRSSESFFLEPLIKNSNDLFEADTTDQTSQYVAGEFDVEELAIYGLCDLNNEQIKIFTKHIAGENATDLLKEIEYKDRWDFARRPQDLIELIGLWNTKGTLGSYIEQHETFLTASLRERPGRPAEIKELSPEDAREAASRLAFALAVSKKRTIVDPEHSGENSSGICVRELLTDWNDAKIKALMRLRLFDPSSYYRIGFHRRDIEEYLAAEYLNKLLNKGIGSKKTKLSLLFTKTIKGKEVLIPTMRQIAVWLAQWDDDVRKKLIEIAPVLLISEGDSEQFISEDKCRILRALVSQSDSEQIASLSYNSAVLRRFASSELVTTLKDLWPEAIKEMRSFILSLISEGEIVGCEPILSEVVNSDSHDPIDRAVAIRALVRLNETKTIESLVQSILSDPHKWSAKTVRSAITDLVPTYLSPEELTTLIQNFGNKEADYNIHLEQSLKIAIEKLSPSDDYLVGLRNGLADLILKNQTEGSAHYNPQSYFSWLASIIADLCNKQSLNVPQEDREDFLHCCIVANHFRERAYSSDNSIWTKLKESITNANYTNEDLLLTQYRFVKNNFEIKKDFFNISHVHSLISCLEDTDKVWLEEVALNTQDKNLSQFVFKELLKLECSQNESKEELKKLYKTVENKKHLKGILDSWLKPKQPYPEEDEEWQKLRKQQENKEAKRLEGWKNWRKTLIKSPDTEFCVAKNDSNLHNFYGWLSSSKKSSGSYQVWDTKAIERAFGKDLVSHVRKLFTSYWRKVDIKPYNERTSDSKGIPYAWVYALNGVIAEAENPQWVNKLNDDEVRKATLLALTEINGLGTYLNDLEQAHPEVVNETLSIEVEAQLKNVNAHQYVTLIQDLEQSSINIKRGVASVLTKYISNWEAPEELNESSEPRFQYTLSQILKMLIEANENSKTNAIEDICSKHFLANPFSLFSTIWLGALMTLNPKKAVSTMEQSLESMNSAAKKSTVIHWFGSLFHPFRGSSKLPIEPDLLSRMAKIAYTYILPSEDQERESGVAYSPDQRDNAQSARSGLINQLTSLEHPDICKILDVMAEDPVFETVSGFIKSRSNIIDISSVEPTPLRIDEIHDFESRLERVPNDRDSLHSLLHSRLEDIQHDITHHDYFPRKTIREIVQEDEMQRTLALLLEKDSNELYSITREDEVADGKKTDIRVYTKAKRLKAVIEIKLADLRWTVADLEKALEDQIKQLYLRHENCKVGYLLITNHEGHENRRRRESERLLERKYWQHPHSKKRMHWNELLIHLQAKADELTEGEQSDILLNVVGLDLRDPILKPAH